MTNRENLIRMFSDKVEGGRNLHVFLLFPGLQTVKTDFTETLHVLRVSFGHMPIMKN